MSHIDLFTGLGGFILACHWNGIQTEVMCEKDERCRHFLERTWSRIPIVNDIREFDGTKWRGRFLLTGGVPCQPASRAGKQRGKADDRWLWPEAIRVVGEALPAWCLFENPPGIYDVGIDGILSDLEGIGYEARPIEIPACAINSPQIRQRVWIVCRRLENSDSRGSTKEYELCNANLLAGSSQGNMAHGSSQRRQQDSRSSSENESEYAGGSEANHNESSGDVQGDMADTISKQHRINETEQERWHKIQGCNDQWSNSIWLPCADGKLRRAPDDTFGLVDGLHRSLLAALGNSIVWEVAYEIIKVIREKRDNASI